MKKPTEPDTLVTRSEIVPILGISRERVRQIDSHDDFPAPVDFVDNGRTPVWRHADIVAYKATRNTARGRRAAEAEPPTAVTP